MDRRGNGAPGSFQQVAGQLNVSSYCYEVWYDEVSLGPNCALRQPLHFCGQTEHNGLDLDLDLAVTHGCCSSHAAMHPENAW